MQERTRRIVLASVLGLIFLILLLVVDRHMLKPLPEGVSTFAQEIDTVFYIIYYITGVVFILVTALLVWFLIRYRAQPGHRAIYSHGSSVLEITWTMVPAAVFIILFLLSQATWAKVKIFPPAGDVEVRALGKQFAWEFTYPGPDGKFDTSDDKTIQGDLHVPVDKVVRVYLRGKDVIHSFFIPTMRLKQDAVPGREIIVWFQATKSGKYEVPCAELCGPGHSGMKGWVTIHPADAYQQWVKQQWPSS